MGVANVASASFGPGAAATTPTPIPHARHLATPLHSAPPLTENSLGARGWAPVPSSPPEPTPNHHVPQPSRPPHLTTPSPSVVSAQQRTPIGHTAPTYAPHPSRQPARTLQYGQPFPRSPYAATPDSLPHKQLRVPHQAQQQSSPLPHSSSLAAVSALPVPPSPASPPLRHVHAGAGVGAVAVTEAAGTEAQNEVGGQEVPGSVTVWGVSISDLATPPRATTLGEATPTPPPSTLSALSARGGALVTDPVRATRTTAVAALASGVEDVHPPRVSATASVSSQGSKFEHKHPAHASSKYQNGHRGGDLRSSSSAVSAVAPEAQAERIDGSSGGSNNNNSAKANGTDDGSATAGASTSASAPLALGEDEGTMLVHRLLAQLRRENLKLKQQLHQSHKQEGALRNQRDDALASLRRSHRETEQARKEAREAQTVATSRATADPAHMAAMARAEVLQTEVTRLRERLQVRMWLVSSCLCMLGRACTVCVDASFACHRVSCWELS